MSPVPLNEEADEQLPYAQPSPYGGQWFYLNEVPPKLLRELQRQCDPTSPIKQTPSTALAKLKAWARPGKRGLDIRLRRKLNAEHDEVTDIHLEKHPLEVELSAESKEILEMPDTSQPAELANERPYEPSRSSTGSTITETLPRYEPPSEAGHSLLDQQTTAPLDDEDRRGRLHQRSFSNFSIVETPKRGLSLARMDVDPSGENVPAVAQGGDFGTSPVDFKKIGDDLGLQSHVSLLDASLQQAHKQLKDERQARAEIERFLNDVKVQLSRQQSTSAEPGTENEKSQELQGLEVTETARCETETDVEPPSPSERKVRPTVRSKKPLKPKRKQSTLVERKSTIPKSTPASEGAEAIWTALLNTQRKMLGQEHPLTYQAKSDLAHSRARKHSRGSRSLDLSALHESETVAKQLLGDTHPLVVTFMTDLSTLASLVGRPQGADEEQPISPGSAQPQLNSVIFRDQSAEIEKLALAQQPDTRGSMLADVARKDVNRVNATWEQESVDIGSRDLPRITTSFHPASKEPSPIGNNVVYGSADPWLMHNAPHKPRDGFQAFSGPIVAAVTDGMIAGVKWLQQHYGPEPSLEPGKVRVRWTCACGKQLFDDFIERRSGAARELEAFLNRPRTHTGSSPTSPSSSRGTPGFTPHSSFGAPPSSQTSWSSNGLPQGSPARDPKSQRTASAWESFHPFRSPPEPPWLLTCANEDRFTPKLAHLDMDPYRVRSDKDLALALRHHYFNVGKKWWRILRLRVLSTIEFVQFEVHLNGFCDVRKCPDVPIPGHVDYIFEPGELIPPVGSQYLLHLFKHPEEYVRERITYLRVPKRNGQLSLGVGWGINLVEGFDAGKVWLVISLFFGLASLVFGIVWAWKKHDIQGAWAVSAWVTTLAGLAFGYLQASLG